MSNDVRLMNFEEFRTNHETVLQQQNDYFRDSDAAESLLRPGGLTRIGWDPWSRNDVKATRDELMSFEQFRANHVSMIHQQSEFFRDRDAADEILRSGVVGAGWTIWPSNAPKVNA